MALITTDIPNLIGGVSQQPDVMRLISQCEVQENAVGSVVEGLKKRPPTESVGSLIQSVASDAFIHHVNRDVDEQYFLVLDGGGTVKAFDMAGNTKTVTVDNEAGEPAETTAYFTSSNPRADFRAATIADVTFLVNTSVKVEQSTNLSTGSVNTHEALVVVRQSPANFSKCQLELSVNGEDANLDSDPGTGGVQSEFGYGSTVGNGKDGITTATQVAAALDAFSPSSGSLDLTAPNTGTTTVYVSANEAFNLTASDGLGGQILSVIKDDIENFADLPSVAKHGMVIRVIGNPETGVDDYYVKFVGDNDQTGVCQGRWVETTAGGIKNAYDFSTMPHVLVRDGTSGNFQLNQSDGSFGGSTAAPMGNFQFTPRQVGDELTNPPPTFVNNKISDIAFFKNRLVLLSGENVILSEVGEYFNFYRTTVAQLLDSDVIDVAVGGASISNLKQAVPFSNRLILFSDRTQFSLQGEQVLSPLTASITPQTAFEITPDTKPVVAGSSLFFAFPRGDFSGVKQFFKVNEVDIQFDAVEASAQVPKYIKGSIKTMAASTHEDMLFAVTDNDPTNLYVYKFMDLNGRRELSAWSKFTFGGNIYSVFLIDTDLFMLIKYGNDLFLEKIQMQTGLTDVNVDYVTTLDRRVYKSTGTYSASTNTTEWTGLGYTPSASAEIYTNTGFKLTVTARGDGTITASGDFSTTPVYIGEPYTMRYEFTKPVIKDKDRFGNQRPMPSMPGSRHQIRYVTVMFDETSFFSIRVTPTNGEPIEYPFSGRFYSSDSSTTDVLPSSQGSFRVPVFSQSSSAKVELLNSSGLPSNFQSAFFEGDLTSRSQKR